MKCPVCQVPTYVAEFDQIELDLCPDCSGLWFDAGELELLVRNPEAGNMHLAGTDEKPRRCPLCRQPMDKVNIGRDRSVVIDACPEGCGLWFDRDELGDLVASNQEYGWHIQPEVLKFLSDMFPSKGES